MKHILSQQFAIVALASLSPVLWAQETTVMEETVVVGKRDNLLGTAGAASQARTSGEELRARPMMRRGEPLGGFDDTHLHPAEPRMFRARLTYKW